MTSGRAPGRAPGRAFVGEALAATRFAIVGLSATATHAGVALALAMPDILPPLLANSVAFTTAFLVSFLGHHLWSLPGMDRRRWRARLVRFLLVALAGLAANSMVLAILLKATILPEGVAIAMAVVTVPIATFLGSRLWAFADGGQTPNEAKKEPNRT